MAGVRCKNGFGRIGRLVFRASSSRACSARQSTSSPSTTSSRPTTSPTCSSTTRPRASSTATSTSEKSSADAAEDDTLVVNGHKIKCLAVKEGPAALPWKDLGVDYVIESTGLFTDAEKAKGHITAGAKKVIISAPAKGEDITVVMGVNHEKYDPAKHNIISQRQLHDELPRAGRPRASQGRLRHRRRPDDHDPRLHRDAEDRRRPVARRTGAAAGGGDRTSSRPRTGAAKAVGLACPEVKGKLTGMAFRVPTPTVSVVDLTVKHREGHELQGNLRGDEEGQRDATSRASSATPTTRSSPATSSTTRAAASSTPAPASS